MQHCGTSTLLSAIPKESSAAVPLHRNNLQSPDSIQLAGTDANKDGQADSLNTFPSIAIDGQIWLQAERASSSPNYLKEFHLELH